MKTYSFFFNKIKNENYLKKYFFIDFLKSFYVSGRDDCLALYSGQSNNNWESVSCYEQHPFICEIPEGKALATNPVVTGVYLQT